MYLLDTKGSYSVLPMDDASEATRIGLALTRSLRSGMPEVV